MGTLEMGIYVLDQKIKIPPIDGDFHVVQALACHSRLVFDKSLFLAMSSIALK